MRSLARETQSWVVQPLVDAGLSAEEIGVLLVRLAFDGIVHAERGRPADAMTPVDGRSPRVRAAWAETVDRMVALGG